MNKINYQDTLLQTHKNAYFRKMSNVKESLKVQLSFHHQTSARYNGQRQVLKM